MARRKSHSATRRGRTLSSHGRRANLSPLHRPLRFEPLEDRHLLALFFVVNINDSGGGSLRSAIEQANAAPGADDILFTQQLSGLTISLTSGELTITEALTIDARPLAENLTINANQASRIFNITTEVFSGQYTLAGLTLTGGKTTALGAGGGAIRSDGIGRLNLDQCTVIGNSTEGTAAPGGGIFAVYDLVLTQSTVSGNQTLGVGAEGGGIYGRSVNLTQSTISGNRTNGTNADGGGIYCRELVLTQSTISGNNVEGSVTRGGGIFVVGGVAFSQSTITNNRANNANSSGGGVFQADTNSNRGLSISGSIVAGNSAATGEPDIVHDPGGTLAVNYSLIGRAPAGIVGIGNTTGLNPLLVPLANNGGPTQTHAMFFGSPAIDAGDPGVVFDPASFDQRGAPFVRVSNGDGLGGARVDMGAYEQQLIDAPLPFLVTTTADELDYSNDSVSLREAIFVANLTSGAETITFAPALSGQTITLGGSELQIVETLTIDARALAENVTINANQLSQIFNITATTGDFTIGGLNLTGANGGAIRSATTGMLSISETTVSGSSDGIHASSLGGSVTLTKSTVSGNSGTGITAKGPVTLTESTVSGNNAGIFNQYGSVTLTKSTVSGNSGRGINIFSYSGAFPSVVTLTKSTVSGNGNGGIHARGVLNYVTLIQSTVMGNTGGGIRVSGDVASVTLTQSTVSGNITTRNGEDGGGILVDSRSDGGNATLTLTESTVSGNSTSGSYGHGGAISFHMPNFTTDSRMTLTRSTIVDNHALHSTSRGGGISLFTRYEPLFINGSILAGNTAGGGGADLVNVIQPINTLTVNYSLIGTGITPTAGGNNVVANNPQLGPLAFNGGPTQTRAPLDGSPAINMGDTSVGFNPVAFDQRGAPFVRVFGGRIDIGAHERQTLDPAMFVVTTAADEYDYANGVVSLREAINSTNGSIGADTITFAPALSGATIMLGGTELVVGNAVTIDARPLAANVTIDAAQQSRIFNITAASGDVTLAGLTLTGGQSAGSGGAILSSIPGQLTLSESTVSGNSTTGNGASGGGIWANGPLTLNASTASGNRTTGNDAAGGGIFANSDVTLNHSTVSGNSTIGAASPGGGILANGSVTLNQSTLSGNRTSGSDSSGGGLWTRGAVSLSQSTVTNNEVTHATSMGGGAWQNDNNPGVPRQFVIDGSILAGNTAAGGGADLVPDQPQIVISVYSLIGTGIFINGGSNNGVTDNPQLGPLANNGGPTQTHAPIANSPAINMGDQGVVFNPAEFDQRGAPFARVVGGRIDIGALEVQVALPGDYNANGVVDAADYTLWRDTLGSTTDLRANGNNTGPSAGVIDQADYAVWKANFGNTFAGSGGGAMAIARSVQVIADETAEVGKSDALTTTEPLLEPLDKMVSFDGVGSSRFIPMVDLISRDRLRSDSPHAGQRDWPVIAARHDRALVAWLSARSAELRHEVAAMSLRELPSEPNVCDSSDQFIDRLDMAFELLGD